MAGKERKNGTINAYLHSLLRTATLRIWVLSLAFGGLAGVLVDVDHIPRWIFDVGYRWSPVNILEFHGGRNLHSLFFILGCCGIACSGGLMVLMVLKRRVTQKIKKPSFLYKLSGKDGRSVKNLLFPDHYKEQYRSADTDDYTGD